MSTLRTIIIFLMATCVALLCVGYFVEPGTFHILYCLSLILSATCTVMLPFARSRNDRHRDNLISILESLATTDHLTNLLNRRGFYDVGERLLNLAKRNQRNLSLITMDIDYFKHINDKYGHIYGDSALQDICEVCKKRLRTSDAFARFGGEEFMVLLPDTALEEAVLVAENLRTQIDRNMINAQDCPTHVTCSFGVTSLDQVPDASLDGLIEAADEALYRAKAEGRNRVCVYGRVA